MKNGFCGFFLCASGGKMRKSAFAKIGLFAANKDKGRLR
jgi:hypothetical protein